MKGVTLSRSFSCILGVLIVNSVFVSLMVETDLQSVKNADRNMLPTNGKAGNQSLASSTSIGRSDSNTLIARNNPAESLHPISEANKGGSSRATGEVVAINDANPPLTRNRFPAFGTQAFNRSCRWALEGRSNILAPTPNCTILGRPNTGHNEGMSAWISQVTAGFIMAKQAGCSFFVDYHEGINISEILVPTGATMDWRIPPNLNCTEDANCHPAWSAYPRGGGPTFRKTHKLFLASVPDYRSPYGSQTMFKNEKGYFGLKRALGQDFDLETSMTCALSTLMQLSPASVNYQPNLFTTILPTLHDPNNALVLSLYIRTGHTEHVHIKERVEKYRKQAEPIIQCALHLEEEYVANKNDNRRVVWMVVTDSQDLKTWITQSHSSKTGDSRQRTILTTQSRGAHTKMRKSIPSTADFAEAFLDWYLIGESDVVVADNGGPSFGNTATFRTARPYYKVSKEEGKCSKVEPVYRW